MAESRYWTGDELSVLRARYAGERTADIARDLGRSCSALHAKAAALGLRKDIEVIAAIARDRSAWLDHGSRRTRFQPGLVPWNKGKPGSTGHHPATRATQFRPGSKPPNWAPVGSYRINAGGILDLKVNDLPGPNNVRWHPVHRLVWQAAHGPVPAGHVVVFRPGMKTTELDKITLDALELITRAENMRRNSVHTNYPPELARCVQLRGALVAAINRKARKEGTTA